MNASELTASRPTKPFMYLPWLPAPIFVLLALLCAIYPGDTVYNPTHLALTLNIIFLTINGLLIAALAARTFLLTGELSVLLLGVGMTALGIANIASPILHAHKMFDAGTAVYNCIMAFTACCTVASALLLNETRRHELHHARWTFLLTGYGAALVITALITAAAYDGALPTHFVSGHGPTLFRQIELIVTITLLSVSALLIIIVSRRTGSKFYFWYAAGVAMLAAGLLGILDFKAIGTYGVWVGRIGQYIGGSYLLVAALIALHQSKDRWTIPLGELIEARERYESLVHVCPDAIVVVREGTIIFANPAAVSLFKAQAAEQLIGREFLETVHPDFEAAAREAFNELRCGARDMTQFEIKAARQDGNFIDVEIVAALVQIHGQPGFQIVLRNCSERKRIENFLSQAKADAEHANRAKDKFLAMLGHELRNPLAPIRNSVTILKRVPNLDPRLDHVREIIERQVDHMTRLVDDLLDVSRITSGKIRLRKEQFDLIPVIQTVVDDQKPFMDSDGIELELHVATPALMVLGDSSRIAQILTNLLVNAGKFTERDGRVRVEVSCERERTVMLSVRDNGIGMDADTLVRLFTPFAQAEQVLDRSRGGLGIGLALVKGLAELHGGMIKASSLGLGRGSHFEVSLPIVVRKPQSAEKPLEPARTASPPRSILIIEDNVDSAETLRLLLEFAGHQVQVAHTGPDGLALAREHKPAVVLCDIVLPGMNGYEVAEAIRKTRELQSVYLVAMTGFGQDEDQKRALRSGFDHHITKPADPDAIERLVTG